MSNQLTKDELKRWIYLNDIVNTINEDQLVKDAYLTAFTYEWGMPPYKTKNFAKLYYELFSDIAMEQHTNSQKNLKKIIGFLSLSIPDNENKNQWNFNDIDNEYNSTELNNYTEKELSDMAIEINGKLNDYVPDINNITNIVQWMLNLVIIKIRINSIDITKLNEIIIKIAEFYEKIFIKIDKTYKLSNSFLSLQQYLLYIFLQALFHLKCLIREYYMKKDNNTEPFMRKKIWYIFELYYIPMIYKLHHIISDNISN